MAAEPTKKDICFADVLFCGATGRTRTGDLLITNQLLYQLSHSSIRLCAFAGRAAAAPSAKANGILPQKPLAVNAFLSEGRVRRRTGAGTGTGRIG